MKAYQRTILEKSGILCLLILLLNVPRLFSQDPLALINHPDIEAEQTSMTAASFKDSKGVVLKTQKAYEVTGFHIVKVGKNVDPVEVVNTGGDYTVRTKSLIATAKPGDTFYFENIKAKLPTMMEESEWVKLNSLVVRIE